MSSEPNAGDFAGVCPYLGLADDADSHATYATEAHRCYRLPNPTRIASGHQETYCLGTNHTTCPVYQGEGLPRAEGAPEAAATAAGVAASAGRPEPRASSGGPFGGARTSTEPRTRGGTAGTRGGKRPTEPKPLGPRPRAGGISMPVATIGLFVMAIIVVVIALAIQQVVGGDDDDTPSAADQQKTATALAPKTGTVTNPTSAGGTQTATGSTPGGTTTPGASNTPGTGAKTYRVQSGDSCSAIASQNNISLDEFFALNPSIDNPGCLNLQVDQVVNIAR